MLISQMNNFLEKVKLSDVTFKIKILSLDCQNLKNKERYLDHLKSVGLKHQIVD